MKKSIFFAIPYVVGYVIVMFLLITFLLEQHTTMAIVLMNMVSFAFGLWLSSLIASAFLNVAVKEIKNHDMEEK